MLSHIWADFGRVCNFRRTLGESSTKSGQVLARVRPHGPKAAQFGQNWPESARMSVHFCKQLAKCSPHPTECDQYCRWPATAREGTSPSASKATVGGRPSESREGPMWPPRGGRPWAKHRVDLAGLDRRRRGSGARGYSPKRSGSTPHRFLSPRSTLPRCPTRLEPHPWANATDPYLEFDAGPQRGVKVFDIVERVVLR